MTTRKSPGAPARASTTTPIADTNRSAYRAQDGYAAPTEDGLAQVVAERWELVTT